MAVSSTIYSSGKIITLWRVIFLVEQYRKKGIVIQDVANILGRSGYFGGTIPVKESVQIGQKHAFLEIRNGVVYLSEYTESKLLPLCDDENPNVEILRKILFPIVVENRFHWLIFFSEDIAIFKISIPPNWIDILNGANLFDFSDKTVVNWWKELLNVFHTHDDERLKEIGDFGEVLTKQFEEDRLSKDGIKNKQFHLRWVSRINDGEGYDFRSIRGSLLKSKNDFRDSIQIEVKASVITNIERFRFKVSRNEWKTALANLDSYFFYCWVGIDIKNQKFLDGPFIIPAKSIVDFFPMDNHETCQWTECRFILDIGKYKIT